MYTVYKATRQEEWGATSFWVVNFLLKPMHTHCAHCNFVQRVIHLACITHLDLGMSINCCYHVIVSYLLCTLDILCFVRLPVIHNNYHIEDFLSDMLKELSVMLASTSWQLNHKWFDDVPISLAPDLYCTNEVLWFIFVLALFLATYTKGFHAKHSWVSFMYWWLWQHSPAHCDKTKQCWWCEAPTNKVCWSYL